LPVQPIRRGRFATKAGVGLLKEQQVEPLTKAQLGQPVPGRPKTTPPAATATDHAAPAKRRTMSAAGRARVAAAQKARWAALKKQQAQPAHPTKPKKRKMSAAGLKAIRAATKKRWEAYRKAHATAA
jgi:hypothetical protein